MQQYYQRREQIVDRMKEVAFETLEPIALEIIAAVLEGVNVQFPDHIEEAVTIWSKFYFNAPKCV